MRAPWVRVPRRRSRSRPSRHGGTPVAARGRAPRRTPSWRCGPRPKAPGGRRAAARFARECRSPPGAGDASQPPRRRRGGRRRGVPAVEPPGGSRSRPPGDVPRSGVQSGRGGTPIRSERLRLCRPVQPSHLVDGRSNRSSQRAVGLVGCPQGAGPVPLLGTVHQVEVDGERPGNLFCPLDRP